MNDPNTPPAKSVMDINPGECDVCMRQTRARLYCEGLLVCCQCFIEADEFAAGNIPITYKENQ